MRKFLPRFDSPGSLLLLSLAGCLSSFVCLTSADDTVESTDGNWHSLFDGQTLGRWQVVKKGDFEQGGQVRVEDGKLILEKGKWATGLRFSGEFPKSGYEIMLEGMRQEGGDFFCGLTFPIGEQSLTLIVGGWGGWVCGLSCIDGRYAINNDTACGVKFKNKVWYRVRLQVTAAAVGVWVDDKQIIDFDPDGHKLTVSEEMQPCLPLGIATWKTTGALRNLRYRTLEKSTQPDQAAP